MHALVTGAAGFIGSHLVERLLADGAAVRGVDCFTDYYEPARKRSNLTAAVDHPSFELCEVDLRDADLGPVLDGVDTVFHLAAQPGVRLSWAEGFRTYEEHNVLATQRLLEGVRARPVARLVLASSSSVYGDAAAFPSREDARCEPHSPYGVTKLAAEALCRAYARNFGVAAVILRYFTVYGPRQRPDMAVARLLQCARSGDPFPMFGDGSQERDFTFVGDIVEATVRAAERPLPAGSILNVSSATTASLADVIATVERTTGRRVPLDVQADQPGDVSRTSADVTRASELLDWKAEVTLAEGIAAQAAQSD